MKIVGLYGYAHSGKDEVGRIMVEKLGYTRFAKGDLIKEAAYRINPVIDAAGDLSHLSDMVDDIGWEEAKKFDMVRRFLQDLPDVTTDVFGRDAWNEALYRAIERSDADKVVLTRLCLPYEVDALKKHRGLLVRVVRLGYGPVNDHPNEVALKNAHPDYIIFNDGSLADLEIAVLDLFGG